MTCGEGLEVIWGVGGSDVGVGSSGGSVGVGGGGEWGWAR